MNWIYLSPHLDDAAFSCGGLIWQQSQAQNAVQIWTLCAGDVPPGPLSAFAQELHARWQTDEQAAAYRRQEDVQACQRLGAGCRHFPVPDCIYRRVGGQYWGSEPGSTALTGSRALPEVEAEFFYASNPALFASIHPLEIALGQRLADELAAHVPAGSELVCPLALGGHVDHRLTRLAAERLQRPLWYYADYPYVMKHLEQLQELLQAGWQQQVFPLSPAGLQAWGEAMAAHRSQLSTFWENQEMLEAQLRQYSQLSGGASLWRSPAELP